MINCLRSAWMIALMGLLRTSEFLVENKRKPDPLRLLTVEDVTWHPNYRECQWIKLHIRASKTDFWREGVHIVIGMTGDPNFCAVTELRIALEERFGGPPDEAKWNLAEPLFLANGFPLSKQRSAGSLKRITKALGWDPKVCGRIGKIRDTSDTTISHRIRTRTTRSGKGAHPRLRHRWAWRP